MYIIPEDYNELPLQVRMIISQIVFDDFRTIRALKINKPWKNEGLINKFETYIFGELDIENFKITNSLLL